MKVSSVTVGLPVSDLERAARWYQQVFRLGEPDLAPADGVLEFQVGPVWLQLHLVPGSASATPGGGTVTRFGVPNVAAERDRLTALGVAVEPLEHVTDAVDFFDFTDLDGNRLSLYSLLDG